MVVATKAVPVSGTAVQQCMCAALDGDSRSLNDTWTRIVFAPVSMVTNAEPVAADVFGGDSLGPLRVAK